MYLEFNSVTIDKFKTFLSPVTLPLTHPNPGLRFIRGRNEAEPDLGSNGAAKSSLFDALCWCLYGQTTDGLRTPDVVPWNTNHVPTVSTILYADDKREVITRRGNKLLHNKVETSQEEISNLLPLEIFKHTVLLGQNADLFFDLSPREKMDILAGALNLDRWETRSDNAKRETEKVEQELADLRASIAELDAHRSSKIALLKQVDEQSTGWAQERAKRQDEYAARLKELRANLEKQQKLGAAADLALDSAETELVALEKQREGVVADLAEANRAVDKAELALQGLEDAAETLETELAQLTGKGDVCPTCGQNLKGTALATHKKKLATQIQGLQNQLVVGIPKKVAHKAKTLSLRLAEIDRHRAAFKEKADTARSTLRMIERSSAPIVADIRGLEQAQKQDTDTNPYREQSTALRKQVKALDVQLDNIEADVADAEKDLARLKFWVAGFKEVRLSLIEEFLQELEMATNAMLPESGLHDWLVHYDIERETKKGTTVAGLNVTILSPRNKEPVKWKVWSGGEKHRLRIVGALALAEVLLSHAGVQTNLEVLDEPTRDLSVEGVQDLFAYLSTRAKQTDKDIFAIDHAVREGRHFAEVITVVKGPDGASTIEPPRSSTTS